MPWWGFTVGRFAHLKFSVTPIIADLVETGENPAGWSAVYLWRVSHRSLDSGLLWRSRIPQARHRGDIPYLARRAFGLMV